MNQTSNPQALYFLGRRIERLIFVGTLILVLCFIETYLATAHRQFVEDRSAIAINELLRRLAAEESSLAEAYQTKVKPAVAPLRQTSTFRSAERRAAIDKTRRALGLPPAPPPRPAPPPKPKPRIPTYKERLDTIVYEVAQASQLRKEEVYQYVDTSKSPADILNILNQHKDTVESKPTTVWGIQTPRLLNVQYAGLAYKVPFGFLSSTLEVALAPLIMAWLGALYMTRQRELIHIAKLEDYKLAFPHILNFLPVRNVAASYVRNRLLEKALTLTDALNRGMKAFVRSCAVLMFAVPMVFSFSYSLYQFSEIGSESVSLLIKLGILVAGIMIWETLALLAQECHFLAKKNFYQ